MGGLPKRQTLLDSDKILQEQRLLVDAGSLLFSQTKLSQGRSGEQAKVNARGVIRAFNAMGYDAVGISRMDLAAGADFLQELQKEAGFSLLSANIVNKDDNSLFFKSHIVKEMAGLSVAVIGLTGHFDETLPGSIQLKTLDWQEVLPGLIETIKPSSQVIVLLSSAPHDVNREISQKFSSINIIVQSSLHPRNLQPQLVNNSLICQTDKEGKYLGRLEIQWNSSGVWQGQGPDDLTILKQEHDRISWQLRKVQSKGDPEIIYKNKPANLRAFRKLEDRKHSIEDEMTALEKRGNAPSDKSIFENTFLELAPEVADAPFVAEIVKSTRKEVNSIGRNKGTTEMLVGYAGSQSCFVCHGDIADRWKKSGHGRAYATLEKREQQYNTNCLPCHVTGISMQDKHLSLSIPETLRNVGCETCHGPALNHALEPEKWPGGAVSPTASLCLQCHNPERDDSFDFEKDSELVH